MDFQNIIQTVTSGGLAAFIVIAVVIMLCAVAVMFFLVSRAKKKYQQFLCVIFDKDGYGNRTITYDNAGIFIDKKTNNKRFFLKKHNVGLSPDNVPAIYDGKNKVVFLKKDGLKNFRFIKIGFKGDVGNERPVMECSEEDVNWAVNSYERQKKFNNAWLEKYLPYIALAIVAMVIMIVFIYFFKDFDKLEKMSVNLKYVADAMLQIQNQTMNYALASNPNYITSGTVLN